MSMATTNIVAQQRFTEMRTGMLLHTPFFASLMLDTLDLRVGKFNHIPTAGTNGRIVWFDEDFLASLTLPEAVFLCCHEIGHAMWMHMSRGRYFIDMGFDGQPFCQPLFNIAADFVINDMLVKSNVGVMPKGGLISKKYTHDMLVDDVYRDLLKNMPRQGDGQPGESGSQDGPPEGSNAGVPSNEGANGMKPLDTHVYEPAQLPEAEMKRAIASAANQAKAMGKMPAGLERWVDSMLAPKVSWKDRLRYLMTRAAERDSTTWASPHRRRLVSQKIYFPSYTGFGAGTIVWATDTSGSMGQKEFDAAFAEVADILQTCRPERVFMMSCDAKVHDVHELSSYTDIYGEKPAMHGGGGTAFEPVFEKVEELHIDPAVLIYFTDGYGSFPATAPDYPVMWVMTTDVEPPFGDCIKVEVANYE